MQMKEISHGSFYMSQGNRERERERRKSQSQRQIHIWVLGTAGLAEARSEWYTLE